MLSILILLAGTFAQLPTGQAWSGSVACNGQCVKSGNRCSGGDTPSILRACCEDTDVCVHGFDDDKDEAFSACVPRDDPGPGDPAECTPVDIPERTCTEDCAATFDACDGLRRDAKGCCSDDDQCVRKNDFYSQCRPKERDPPASWDAEVLTCRVNCADPEAIASSWSGYELSNRDLLLATFGFGDLGADYSPFDGATCEAMCTADPRCIAYQENDDGGNECNLYEDGVIAVENAGKAEFRPNFDSVLNFVKCYRPPSLCPEDTVQEVDGTDPQLYELTDEDKAVTFLNREFALGDCASICRLHPELQGDKCVGFALRGTGACWILFGKGGSGRQELRMLENQTVYSISGCL